MRRRQRRPGPACDGPGPGRGQRSGAGRRDGSGRAETSLGGRTATRALIAVGAYVVQDLRDAEGLTRPLLRRAALRLAVCPSEPVSRIGSAYLRLDPPEPGEVRRTGDIVDVHGAASPPRSLPAPPASNAPGTTAGAADREGPR